MIPVTTIPFSSTPAGDATNTSSPSATMGGKTVSVSRSTSRMRTSAYSASQGAQVATKHVSKWSVSPRQYPFQPLEYPFPSDSEKSGSPNKSNPPTTPFPSGLKLPPLKYPHPEGGTGDGDGYGSGPFPHPEGGTPPAQAMRTDLLAERFGSIALADASMQSDPSAPSAPSAPPEEAMEEGSLGSSEDGSLGSSEDGSLGFIVHGDWIDS